jgi:comEA protein
MWKGKPKIKFREAIKRNLDSIKEGWGRFLIAIHIRKPAEHLKKKDVLPDLSEEKLDVGEFVEKHRFSIGGILIVLILISGGFLLYRDNYFKPAMEKEIADQDARISDLEAEIENINSSKNTVEASTQTVAPTTTQPSQTGQVAGASTAASVKLVGKVNINIASAGELDTLPGIGTAYAGRIIDYRTSHGGFKSIEELKNVKGIGDKTFEKLADLVTI